MEFHGLKGIELKRGEKFIRPLIKCSREDIENYCEENKLNPKIDISNKENIYTRNKIRNLLIPYIEKEFNPNIINSINNLSNVANSENEYIERITEDEYKKVLIKENIKQNEIILNLKEFNLLHLVIKNRIVIYTINRLFGTCKDIEKVHIEDIIKLCSNNIGNKYLTPNKNIKILINKGKIFIKKLN